MNAAVRLVSSSQFVHITPLLRQLHWLKASERIAFKCAALVDTCLYGSAPSYLVDELCQVADVEARRRLRSASPSSLIVGRTRPFTVGTRRPSLSGCRCSWNSLPQHVTSAPSLLVFQLRLKTNLFTISYPSHAVTMYSVSQKNPPSEIFCHFFPNGWEFFAHLLYVPIYTGLQVFI